MKFSFYSLLQINSTSFLKYWRRKTRALLSSECCNWPWYISVSLDILSISSGWELNHFSFSCIADGLKSHAQLSESKWHVWLGVYLAHLPAECPVDPVHNNTPSLNLDISKMELTLWLKGCLITCFAHSAGFRFYSLGRDFFTTIFFYPRHYSRHLKTEPRCNYLGLTFRKTLVLPICQSVFPRSRLAIVMAAFLSPWKSNPSRARPSLNM